MRPSLCGRRGTLITIVAPPIGAARPGARFLTFKRSAFLIAGGLLHIFAYMKPDEMIRAVDRATELLKALAGRSRLLLLCHLSEGEKSVGELARLVGARDTAVSQQLALLRKDGLVLPRRSGQTIFYSLASPEAARMLETLHALYCLPAIEKVATEREASS